MADNNNAQSQFQSAFPATGFGSSDGGGFTNAGGGGGFTNAGGGMGGTNAVSEIFGGSTPPPEDKTKRLMIIGGIAAGLTVCVLAAVYFMQPHDEESEDEATPPVAAADANTEEEAAADDEEEVEDDAVAEDAPVAASDVSEWTYNLQEGGISVSVPDGTKVEVSRDASFSSLFHSGTAAGGKFRISPPPPGKVYWRAENKVHEITVHPAAALGISFQNPGSLSSGGSMSWSAAGSASYYTVVFAADQAFQSVVKSYSTTGTSVTVEDITPGKYFVRIAGLNVASGQWENSDAQAIEVK